MEFKQAGNLGKTDLLKRLIFQKRMSSEDEEVFLTSEEAKEVEDQLDKFMYLLSNLNLHHVRLKEEGFTTISDIVEELEPLYRNYKGEEK